MSLINPSGKVQTKEELEKVLSSENSTFPIIYRDAHGYEWNRKGFNSRADEFGEMEKWMYEREVMFNGSKIVFCILLRSDGTHEYMGMRPFIVSSFEL